MTATPQHDEIHAKHKHIDIQRLANMADDSGRSALLITLAQPDVLTDLDALDLAHLRRTCDDVRSVVDEYLHDLCLTLNDTYHDGQALFDRLRHSFDVITTRWTKCRKLTIIFDTQADHLGIAPPTDSVPSNRRGLLRADVLAAIFDLHGPLHIHDLRIRLRGAFRTCLGHRGVFSARALPHIARACPSLRTLHIIADDFVHETILGGFIAHDVPTRAMIDLNNLTDLRLPMGPWLDHTHLLPNSLRTLRIDLPDLFVDTPAVYGSGRIENRLLAALRGAPNLTTAVFSFTKPPTYHIMQYLLDHRSWDVDGPLRQLQFLYDSDYSDDPIEWERTFFLSGQINPLVSSVRVVSDDAGTPSLFRLGFIVLKQTSPRADLIIDRAIIPDQYRTTLRHTHLLRDVFGDIRFNTLLLDAKVRFRTDATPDIGLPHT